MYLNGVGDIRKRIKIPIFSKKINFLAITILYLFIFRTVLYGHLNSAANLLLACRGVKNSTPKSNVPRANKKSVRLPGQPSSVRI